MNCYDDQVHIWYPTHDWCDGTCARCGQKQPGMSDEAREEMRDQREAKRKTYAYVASETCCYTRAFEPGEEHQGQRISRHGDYVAWTRGKRDTLSRCTLAGWEGRAARAVADRLGWR